MPQRTPREQAAMAAPTTVKVATSPEIAGEIILLHPDQIDASDRLRPIDPIWAAALGRVMKAEGQRTPIEVCRLPGRSGYKLVTGGHRHAGAVAEGLQLRAEVVSSDAADRRLREVSENLWRRELSPIDRAAFIAELVTLHKVRAGIDPSKDGRAASANARWQKELKDEAEDTNATIALAYGWTETVADQVGLSKRSVEYDLLLHRRIPAGLIERLRAAESPVLRNATQLRALAKLSESEQHEVATLLIDGTAKSVGEAIGTLHQRPQADAETKRLSTFIGTFGRMGLAEKKGAISALRPHLPKGVSVGEAQDQDEQRRDELLDAIDTARELIEAMLEDDLIADPERAAAFKSASTKLQLSRFALVVGSIPLGVA